MPSAEGDRTIAGVRRAFGLVAALAVTGVLASCGSSSHATANGTTASNPAASSGSSTGSGPSLLFGALCTMTGPSADTTCASATQAVFDKVNAAGGVHGNKLRLDVCDTTFSDPQALPDCESKLVNQDHVLAFVGNGVDQGLNTLADPAGIPNIGSIGIYPYDWSDPLSFPVGASVTSDDIAMAAFAISNGAKKVGILYNTLPGVQGTLTPLESYINSHGATYVGIAASSTSPSFEPFLARAKSDGLDWLIISEGTAAATLPVLNAGQSIGYSPNWLITRGAFDKEFFHTISSAYSSDHVYVDYWSRSWNDPGAAQFLQTMQKYGPKNMNITFNGVESWEAANVLVQALEAIPAGSAISSHAIVSALGHLQYSDGLLPQSINYASLPGPCAGEARIPNGLEFVLSANTAKLASPTPFNTCG